MPSASTPPASLSEAFSSAPASDSTAFGFSGGAICTSNISLVSTFFLFFFVVLLGAEGFVATGSSDTLAPILFVSAAGLQTVDDGSWGEPGDVRVKGA
eukprot:1177273-Prorocentrum_minimum.AAC.2